ncbi:hypothetical protein D3C71_2248920 [compost metagenome]
MKRLHIAQEEMMLRASKILIEGTFHATRNLHLNQDILFQSQHCGFYGFGQLDIGIIF